MSLALNVQGSDSQASDELQSVLIITQSAPVAERLRAFLERVGLTVMESRTETTEGIEVCRRLQPDMAIIDIDQCVGDRSLTQEMACDLETPVVVVGPADSPAHIESANEAGALAYLVQPVSADQLMVSIHIAHGRYDDIEASRDEIENLKRRLTDRKVIEQAKWVLVQRLNVSEPDAMRLLQRHARNKRRPLADVATSIIEMQDLFDFTALAG